MASAEFSTYSEQSPYLLRWDLSEGSDIGIFGGLQRGRATVSISPQPVLSLVDFVLWYRNFVPSEETLFLHQSSSERVLKLDPDLTREAILYFTGLRK